MGTPAERPRSPRTAAPQPADRRNAVTRGETPPQRPDPPADGWADLHLLTADDVCALLQVKKSWLYDAVETGAIIPIRLGRQLRFRPSDIAAYIDQLAG